MLFIDFASCASSMTRFPPWTGVPAADVPAVELAGAFDPLLFDGPLLEHAAKTVAAAAMTATAAYRYEIRRCMGDVPPDFSMSLASA